MAMKKVAELTTKDGPTLTFYANGTFVDVHYNDTHVLVLTEYEAIAYSRFLLDALDVVRGRTTRETDPCDDELAALEKSKSVEARLKLREAK